MELTYWNKEKNKPSKPYLKVVDLKVEWIKRKSRQMKILPFVCPMTGLFSQIVGSVYS